MTQTSSTAPGALPVLPGDSLADLLNAEGTKTLEPALVRFLQGQRWFAAKTERDLGIAFADLGTLDGDERFRVGEAVVRTGEGEQRYLLPLTVGKGPDGIGPGIVAATSGGERLLDATRDAEFSTLVTGLIAKGGTVEIDGGELRFEGSSAKGAELEKASAVEAGDIKPLSGEQSNTSIGVGPVAILKFYRLLRDGIQPELEVTRFLTEKTSFTAAPALFGSVELRRADGSTAAVAALFERVRNAADAWASVTGALADNLRGAQRASPAQGDFDAGRTIGRRTGEMHAALATRTGDPAFDPEPLDETILARLVDEARHEASGAIAILRGVEASAETHADIARLSEGEAAIGTWFESFKSLRPAGHRTRIHGDYHLGQLLVSNGDVVILDFEGEPGRPLEERRAKTSPLRDVAGMLRSYDYAAFAALDALRSEDPAVAERAQDAAVRWRDETSAAFLEEWQRASGVDLSDEGNARLLDLFLLQKAFYELRYEAAMRPAWLSIPLRGIVSLLQKRQVLS